MRRLIVAVLLCAVFIVSAHVEHATSTADSHPDQHGQRPALLGSGVTDQEAQVDPAPGIGCLAKDGETADCSKDPAVVKEAIKLIEKSPHPNAAVRVIQRSKGHTRVRKRAGHVTRERLQNNRNTKLAKQVKDLQRQLALQKAKTIEMAKMQRAAKSPIAQLAKKSALGTSHTNSISISLRFCLFSHSVSACDRRLCSVQRQDCAMLDS